MNYKQFNDIVSELDVFASKAEAKRTVEDILAIIKDELVAGNEVVLSQFGTFRPTNRSGKAPGTGKPYSTNLVKFSISAPFKRTLNP